MSALAIVAALTLAWFSSQEPSPPADPSLRRVVTAEGQTSASIRTITKSTHVRLQLAKDVQRVAVGDPEILHSETLSPREILLLGKDVGRTSLIVWFTDGSLETLLFAVVRDLSVLEAALRDVDPSITVEMTPDRDAVVLRGLVPDIVYSNKAVDVAVRFLDAGASKRAAQKSATAGDVFLPGTATAPSTGEGGTAMAQAPRVSPSSDHVINLIRLANATPRVEERIFGAIQGVGGADVRIRRVQRGAAPNDDVDVLVLEGSVQSQTELIRVLTLTSRIFLNQKTELEDIRVVADESGALSSGTALLGAQAVGSNQSLSSPILADAGITGNQNINAQLSNRVRTNLARAKVIEIAGGRIISFIRTKDLPEVRVNVKLFEVNRTRLYDFQPKLAWLLSNFTQPALLPGATATTVQGAGAASVGSSGTSEVQNALGFLNGTFSNELQFSGSHFALDLAFSILEQEGIARSLSQPSLTVLSGEIAQFQVGGSIPVPVSFSPAFGNTTTTGGTGTSATTPGVFNSVEFVPFGVTLAVRPLVDDEFITLDVLPQVSTPDEVLTVAIKDTTGTNPATTAFETRNLKTSARLRDGQALLIGGLLTKKSSDAANQTPILGDIPILGWLFRGAHQTQDDQELVVVVTPAVVRDPVLGVGLWAFPDPFDLLRASMPAKKRSGGAASSGPSRP